MVREVERQRHDAILYVVDGDHQNGYDAHRGEHRRGNDGEDHHVDEEQAQKVFAELFEGEQQAVAQVFEDVFRFARAYLRQPLANDRHSRRGKEQEKDDAEREGKEPDQRDQRVTKEEDRRYQRKIDDRQRDRTDRRQKQVLEAGGNKSVQNADVETRAHFDVKHFGRGKQRQSKEEPEPDINKDSPYDTGLPMDLLEESDVAFSQGR